MTGERLYQRDRKAETVACWHCGDLLRVHFQPLWGLCWFCGTATGTDGRMYRLVYQEYKNYPPDHPQQWKVVEVF